MRIENLEIIWGINRQKLKKNADACRIWPLLVIIPKVEPLFHLGREEELTAVLEEIIAINPHSPLKAFLNCLRKDRDKAQY